MLKGYFDKLTIREKLYTMHFVVTGSSMLLLFIILVVYQYLSIKQDLLNDLDSQISIIENNVAPAIAFEDQKATSEILNALSLNDSVEGAYIALNNRSIFAQYQHPVSRLSSDDSVRKKSAIHISKDIVINGHQVGTLVLDANLNVLYSRLKVFSIAILLSMSVAMALAKVLSVLLNRFISEPIIYLKSLVANITNNQDYIQRSQIQSLDEIGALSTGINNMLENIQLRDQKLLGELAQRSVFEQKLDQLAYYDINTGLPNRHFFADHISKLIQWSDANNSQFYLLFLDLDNFKIANDTMGHEAGDTLLKLCAQRLKAVIHSDDQVCRVGGDEFAITLRSVDSPYDVEIICNRIIHAISQKFVIESQEVFVGASIGAVLYANRNYSESTLIKNADIAMYWAKADGKNTYKFYSQSIAEVKFHQQKIVTSLQKSLSNDELDVYYQPIIDVASGLMIGFEALLRWNQPELGMVSPSVFIPIAENTGLINPIGSFVIDTALSQVKKWQTKYNTDLFMNINISGRQFHDKNIVNKISTAIYRTGVNPKTINFELTESVLMDDINASIHILKSLRLLGISISIDDFGTGHSSMSYLKQLPINTIKIDKSFVHGVPDDKVDTAIIESIFALANSLQLNVVAEGVETEAQLAFIKNYPNTKAQGFLFSKPVAADEIEVLFDEFHANTTPYLETIARENSNLKRIG